VRSDILVGDVVLPMVTYDYRELMETRHLERDEYASMKVCRNSWTVLTAWSSVIWFKIKKDGGWTRSSQSETVIPDSFLGGSAPRLRHLILIEKEEEQESLWSCTHSTLAPIGREADEVVCAQRKNSERVPTE
jgi:hypothetical protein